MFGTVNKAGDFMFYIIVILAGIFAMPAKAQSLKEQIVGTWTLVSCTNPDLPWCAGNNGIQVFDASGHYVTMMAARGRPKVTIPGGGPAGADRNAPTPEQYKAIAAGLFAQFGTWSINEANKTFTLHSEGALFPNDEGTDFATFTVVNISGDELRIALQTGQPAVWRRLSN
jgi:hypothetical protein